MGVPWDRPTQTVGKENSAPLDLEDEDHGTGKTAARLQAPPHWNGEGLAEVTRDKSPVTSHP